MRPLSDTISRLKRFKTVGPSPSAPASSALVELSAFGTNPGQLRALLHVPADLPAGAPLVLVLHGCTQTADGYDRGSGWSALADRFGFAVLFGEQVRGNNPNLCFNWFSTADTRRGSGEAESLREMVAAVVAQYRIDPARVFVTGLSAGGAMTSVMLAAYPDVFAGGAIIAGLPYGVASSVPQAFDRMRGHGHDRTALARDVREASSHQGPWPRVSVWHGTADATVDAVNAAMIIDQWRGIHGVDGADTTDRVDGQLHRQWHDASGHVVIEEYAIAGMSHGTPIATAGDQAFGTPGPYMLDAGISSTYRIAAFWGIVPAEAPRRSAEQPTARTLPADPAAARLATSATPAASATVTGAAIGGRFDPARTINDALRAAGLLKP